MRFNRSFNQLISNHLKDFILDDIETTNFLPFRLIIQFCPDRDHRKGVIKMRLRAVSYFSLDTVDCEQALWASGEAVRNEG